MSDDFTETKNATPDDLRKVVKRHASIRAKGFRAQALFHSAEAIKEAALAIGAAAVGDAESAEDSTIRASQHTTWAAECERLADHYEKVARK